LSRFERYKSADSRIVARRSVKADSKLSYA
jgi:hypothetical protein